MPYMNKCDSSGLYIPPVEDCDECAALGDQIEALQKVVSVVQDNVNNLETAVEDKVDKVEGKGLSTNDFTNALKKKLDGISDGAEANREYTAFTGLPTGNQTPGFGETFSVSQIKQSTDGQVSGARRYITIPNDPATAEAAGLMSASDKAILDALVKRMEKIETLLGNKKNTVLAMTDANGNETSVTVLAE